jgi:dipeptidyl aminopeptidase/acylaminoacyl peptidase
MSIDKRDFQRAVDLFGPSQPAFDRLVRRRRRRERRRRIGAGIAAVIVIALAAALIGRSFTSDRPADVDETPMLHASKPGIWIVDPISDTVRFVWGPDWIDDRHRPFGNEIGAATMSPGGDRIAFVVRNHDPYQEGFWTISSSGGDPQQICPSDPSCVPSFIGPGTQQPWSPDGRSLLFAGGPNSQGNPSDIYAVNADGTGLRRLESMPGEEDVADWSPDGKQIVFDHEGEIDVAALNGGAPVVLVKRGNFPRWSPDGRWIAFTRNSGRTDAVWLVRPDGTDAHVVAEGDYAAGWSPDGSQVAVLQSQTATSAPNPHFRRYAIVDVDTGQVKSIDIETPDTSMLLFQWPTGS